MLFPTIDSENNCNPPNVNKTNLSALAHQCFACAMAECTVVPAILPAKSVVCETWPKISWSIPHLSRHSDRWLQWRRRVTRAHPVKP